MDRFRFRHLGQVRLDTSGSAYWLFVLLPLLLLAGLLSVYEVGGVAKTIDWVPSLAINLSFGLDALSLMFAGLICGVGVLIQIYALAYMRSSSSRFSFHLYLSLFMLAMLGVVTSDNILLLFVFWELTTITSYLLIGFNHEKAKSRRNALQSLFITGAGGLALLAGLIMLGQMAGSYQISTILAQASHLAEHELFTPSLVLVLLGAITKSAQFPFHFWLPNAMAAPTPVSAYLHSATMVKAGIYLLARFSPLYSSHPLWLYGLVSLGAITAIWCALQALRQTDIKLMAAYSTNVALGKLSILLGLGTELAFKAMLLFICAHAFYKAALFMVIGNIDKATGTRDIQVLRGLKATLLFSFVAVVVAALSKAGIPPLFGFLSKEYMYKAALDSGGWMLLATGVFLLINALMVAMALLLVIKPFLGQTQIPVQQKPVERDMGLWLPPLILALASLFVPTVGLGWFNTQLLFPGLAVYQGSVEAEPIKLWQGFNLPLVLSAVTLLLGVVIYKLAPKIIAIINQGSERLPKADLLFDRFIDNLVAVAKWQTQLLQPKRLSIYALFSFAVLALMLLSQFAPISMVHLEPLNQLHLYEVAIAALLVAAAMVCLFTTSRLLAVSALGVVGFMTTLVFMLYSAPDVAKTLLLVETLMVVFVVLFIRHMPQMKQVTSHSFSRRVLHGVIAASIGLSISLLLINITAQPLDRSVADYFSDNSVLGGFGRNVVNVILVDFRALDTLGEAVVVVIAGICAVNLIKPAGIRRAPIQSLIFRPASHLVAALMLVFSFYLLLRGHNAPGGGFIGALIAVIGLALLMFAETPSYVRNRIIFAPFSIALFGVMVCLLAGLISLVLGMPFLTGLWWKEILPLGTPLVFDIGIYLAVIGGVMGILLKVNEELD